MQTTDSTIKNHWKNLHGKQKIQYILDYYKLPIAVCLIFLYIIGYMYTDILPEKTPCCTPVL